jgi:hexosaminidase
LLGGFVRIDVSVIATVSVDETYSGIDPLRLQALADSFHATMPVMSDGGHSLKLRLVACPPGALVQHDAHGAITGPEAYELVVQNSSITITASAMAGMIYGTKTALQLLTGNEGFGANVVSAPSSLPALRIVDAPISRYRGVMIDNVRNAHSFEFHMSMLDQLGKHKLNIYQLHASDDQGYSMPSDAFPALPFSSALTTDQARQLQAKAASLGIEIVAEIDLPGTVRYGTCHWFTVKETM